MKTKSLKQDIKSPLHEVQRAWIRKPATVIITLLLFFPAIFLELIILTSRFFTDMYDYLKAAYYTYKGLKR